MSRYISTLFCMIIATSAYADINTELPKVEKQHCPIILDQSSPCPSAFQSICQAVAAGDQSTIDQLNAHCAGLPDIPVKSLFEIALEKVEPHYEKIAGVLIAGLLALLALLKTKLERVRRSASEALKRLADPFLGENFEYDSRALNVILVGEGGSGKTTLIHSLTAAPEAVPAIATDSISTYSLVQEMTVTIKNKTVRRLFRIFIDDYVGQRFVDALNHTDINRRLDKVPATLLVIVVDLFKYEKSKQGQLRQKIDPKRVKDQLAAYHDNVVQLLLDRASSSKHIVLFINKIDMISPMTPEIFQAAEKAYEELINTLNDVRGKQLHVIVGSARAGIGVVGYDEGHVDQKSLLQVMHDASKPIMEDPV